MNGSIFRVLPIITPARAEWLVRSVLPPFASRQLVEVRLCQNGQLETLAACGTPGRHKKLRRFTRGGAFDSQTTSGL